LPLGGAGGELHRWAMTFATWLFIAALIFPQTLWGLYRAFTVTCRALSWIGRQTRSRSEVALNRQETEFLKRQETKGAVQI
jgi:hypothetical protein